MPPAGLEHPAGLNVSKIEIHPCAANPQHLANLFCLPIHVTLLLADGSNCIEQGNGAAETQKDNADPEYQ